MKLSVEEYQTCHVATFFFRPTGLGQHRIALHIQDKLEGLGALAGPTNRSGYTPMTTAAGTEFDLSTEEMVVLAAALDQGYEGGAYEAGVARFVPSLIDRLRTPAQSPDAKVVGS